MYPKWAARGARLAHKPHEHPLNKFATPHAISLAPSPRVPNKTVPTQKISSQVPIKYPPPEEHKISPPSPVGTLVEYFENGVRRLGSIKHPNDAGWVVISEDNQEFTLSEKMVTFQWPSHYMGQNYHYGPSDIGGLESFCRDLIDKHTDDLKIAWGNFVDKKIPLINAETLAKFLFGSFPKPHEMYVAHCILMEDQLHFERVEGIIESTSYFPTTTWKCRSLQNVMALRKQQAAKVSSPNKLNSFLEKAKQVLHGFLQPKKEMWETDNDRPFVKHLVQFAISKANDTDTKFSHQILTNLKYGKTAHDAFSFLVSIAFLTKYQNLNPLRFSRDLKLSDLDQKKITHLLTRNPNGYV